MLWKKSKLILFFVFSRTIYAFLKERRSTQARVVQYFLNFNQWWFFAGTRSDFSNRPDSDLDTDLYKFSTNFLQQEAFPRNWPMKLTVLLNLKDKNSLYLLYSKNIFRPKRYWNVYFLASGIWFGNRIWPPTSDYESSGGILSLWTLGLPKVSI
jgi:hypothetical protein